MKRVICCKLHPVNGPYGKPILASLISDLLKQDVIVFIGKRRQLDVDEDSGFNDVRYTLTMQIKTIMFRSTHNTLEQETTKQKLSTTA